MNPLVSTLKLPIIIRSSNASELLLSFDYLCRVEDCIAILNRIANKWDQFHCGLERDTTITDDIKTEIRLETIEATYSFITFTLLLTGFYKGLFQHIAAAVSRLHFDVTNLAPYPRESQAIALMRTIRNKMIGHTADMEPRDDTLANRLAYLEWYVGHWGLDSDTRNRRLNTFGLQVGDETSTHAIPPTFGEMIAEVQSFIVACDRSVLDNGEYLANQTKNHGGHGFLFVTFYPE